MDDFLQTMGEVRPPKYRQPLLNLNSTTGDLSLSYKPITFENLQVIFGTVEKYLVTHFQSDKRNHRRFKNWDEAYKQNHDFDQFPLRDAYEIHGVLIKPRKNSEPQFWANYPEDETKVAAPFRWLCSTTTQLNCIWFCLGEIPDTDEIAINLMNFKLDKQSGYFAPELETVNKVKMKTAHWAVNISA